jgi:hypothetical protein
MLFLAKQRFVGESLFFSRSASWASRTDAVKKNEKSTAKESGKKIRKSYSSLLSSFGV